MKMGLHRNRERGIGIGNGYHHNRMSSLLTYSMMYSYRILVAVILLMWSCNEGRGIFIHANACSKQQQRKHQYDVVVVVGSVISSDATPTLTGAPSQEMTMKQLCTTIDSIIRVSNYRHIYLSLGVGLSVGKGVGGGVSKYIDAMQKECPETKVMRTAVISKSSMIRADTLAEKVMGKAKLGNIGSQLGHGNSQGRLTWHKDSVRLRLSTVNALRMFQQNNPMPSKSRGLIILRDDVVLAPDFDFRIRCAMSEAREFDEQYAIALLPTPSSYKQSSKPGAHSFLHQVSSLNFSSYRLGLLLSEHTVHLLKNSLFQEMDELVQDLTMSLENGTDEKKKSNVNDAYQHAMTFPLLQALNEYNTKRPSSPIIQYSFRRGILKPQQTDKDPSTNVDVKSYFKENYAYDQRNLKENHHIIEL